MSIIHSLQASAAFLSFCTLSQAWVLNRKADARIQEADAGPTELRRNVHQAINIGRRQDITLDCPQDRWEELLNNNPARLVMTFCNEWLGIPPTTAVLTITPTITITTSNAQRSTVTSTERKFITDTTTETVTTTVSPVTSAPQIEGRAANAIAIAESIFRSVVESGTTSESSTTKNPQRVQAESGLDTACSCKNVDPTSTVTRSYTTDAVFTTVGHRKLIIKKVTETLKVKDYSTVTVTLSAPTDDTSSDPTSTAKSPLESDASNGTFNASSIDEPNGNISASDGGEISPVSLSSVPTTILPTTTLISASAITRGVVSVNASSTTGPGTVVTAIPFNCPGDANKRANQIVNDFRFEYLILCNTEIITKDRIGRPIPVASENDCTAQCSVLNSASGKATCQAAAFTPNSDGRPGGTCVISGSETEYVDKPGAITIVNTGISSNGDECAALNQTDTGSNSTVNTSALIASLTTASVTISTPGLITQTADGGVFETYVSANSTDASGYIHWKWYRVSASSSYWWAVYGTSWACTKTLTQTIKATPAANDSAIITTIINGGTTIIISGSSTRTIIEDGGVVGPPTFVPATVTGDDGEFTTFFSEATATSTGGSGIVPPTNIPINSTTAAQGSANVSVSFATSTIFSTGDEGVIPPSVSTSLSPQASGNTTANITVIVSSGGSQSSTPGSAFAANSTGGSGVVPPASTGGSAAFTTSGATFAIFSTNGGGGYGFASSTTNWTYPNSTAISVSSGMANLTVASSTFAVHSTDDSGVIPPASVAPSTSVVSVTVVVSLNGSIPVTFTQPSNFSTGGSAGFTTSGATAVANSTGGNGVLTPSPASTPPGNPSQLVSSGSANFTTGSSTITANSTGTNGIIPPPGASTSTVRFANTTSPTTETPRTNTLPPFIILSTGGTANFSTSGGIATSSGTGASGVIPPASTNVTSAAPSPSIGTNATVSSGATTIETSGSIAVIESTGTEGIIPPASGNATSTQPASFTPSPSLNVTTSIPVSSSPIPSTNATSSTPTSSSPIPSLNATTIVITNSTTVIVATSTTTEFGPPPDNTTTSLAPPSNITILSTGGVTSITLQNSTATTFSTGTGGIITPSANASQTTFSRSVPEGDRSGSFSRTTSRPSSEFIVSVPNSTFTSFPSGSPTPSGNSTTSAPLTSLPSGSPTPSSNSTTFTPVSRDLPSPSLNSTTFAPVSSGSPSPSLNGTTSAPVSSGSPSPSLNSTTFAPVSSLPSGSPSPSLNSTTFTPVSSGSPTPSLNSTTFTPFSNGSTASVPSASPTPSLNSTTVGTPPNITISSFISGSPTPSSNLTTGTPFTNSGGDRTGGPPKTPSRSSSGFPTPSINGSIPVVISTSTTTTTLGVSSSIPPASFNLTTPPSPTGGSSTLPPFGNSTIPTGTGFTSASISVPVPSFNSSVPSITPSISANSTSRPSGSPTPSLNVTTSDICPTAPVIITQTVSIAAETQLLTTTLIQIQTVTVVASASSGSPATSSANPSATSVAVTDLTSRLRVPGQSATQSQIDAACKDPGNIVLNPDFAKEEDATVPGWSIAADPNTQVDSVEGPDGNGTAARFSSSVVGRSLTITQALIVCPDTQYDFSLASSQNDPNANCNIDLFVAANDRVEKILSVQPTTTEVSSTTSFTAWPGNDRAAADIKITIRCDGYAGALVGPDGYMTVDLREIRVAKAA